MDENNNDTNISNIERLLSPAPIIKELSDLYALSITNKRLKDYTTSRAKLDRLPDDIAKKLHEAIALGGESVKRSLALWYADKEVLEAMTSIVDMCVAYIGEEVTEILRKYSNI